MTKGLVRDPVLDCSQKGSDLYGEKRCVSPLPTDFSVVRDQYL